MADGMDWLSVVGSMGAASFERDGWQTAILYQFIEV
jgi:hypothetical protein